MEQLGNATTDISSEGVERRSRARVAFDRLRTMVLKNELPPGSSYLEVELAQMLGMSRTPVREAAIILEGRGLVEMRPRRGMRVLPVSARDLSEIYEILTEVEPVAVRRLAGQGMQSVQAVAFEADLARMDAALAANAMEDWVEADDVFHRRFADACDNQRLTSVVHIYADQVHRARLFTMHHRPVPQSANAEHRRMIEAIRQRDGAAAAEICRLHRLEEGEAMQRALKELGRPVV